MDTNLYDELISAIKQGNITKVKELILPNKQGLKKISDLNFLMRYLMDISFLL